MPKNPKNPLTLKYVVRLAQKRGFDLICSSELGIHQEIKDFLDETERGGPKEYIIFGNLIIRITDAWKEDAEYYELS